MTTTPDPLLELNRTEEPLTVGALRAHLALYPDDQVVILSSDGEGNKHSPLAGVYEGIYVPESTWAGDVYMTPEQVTAQGPEATLEDDSTDDETAIRVLVFVPTN